MHKKENRQAQTRPNMDQRQALLAYKQHRPYLPGQPIAINIKCPLPNCQGDDSAGRFMLECTHPDVKKQHIARHDTLMRMLIRAFTRGKHGSHYLIADVGTMDKLKDIGVHSKRVPTFILPDSHLPEANHKHKDCRADDNRHKMRPDMMVVEMTEREQRSYLPHDASTGRALPHLSATMPNGRRRKITIVEGGYCRDTSYLEKLEEKGQQHAKLEDALRTFGYEVKSVTYICGCTGSLFRSNSASMRELGIESTDATTQGQDT